VRIYTLAGTPATASADDFTSFKAEHDAGLAAYRGQRWDDAKRHFAHCRDLCAAMQDRWQIQHYYEIFAERVAEFEHNPPGPGWDGVYVATSK
jgi:adenylate cyclase